MSADVRRVWADRIRTERKARGWDKPEMARQLAHAAGDARRSLPDHESLLTYVKRWERAAVSVSERYRLLYARAFGMSEAEVFDLRRPVILSPAETAQLFTADQLEPRGDVAPDGEIEALELTRRVAASDVGTETLGRLEQAVDDLAIAYPRTPPAELLQRVRRHLVYVANLLDARKTLSEHRRLLVVGGWLSLLGATCHIDLHQRPAAAARLRTAARLAEDTGHAEIAAWCLETEAWQALTDGDYRQAVTLSQGAQTMAPRGSSAYIQASAQEGRAWARLQAARETRELLDRVAALACNLPAPEHPEHHYRYDPAKADAYTATTLAWLGDPAAEPYARQVLARMQAPADGRIRARRVASARLDLSLALVAADRPDEAAHETLTAVTSGVLVPSNYWRAAEVIGAVEATRVSEMTELREAYRELCGLADG
ncbi:MAG: transcriptional regulator, family [Actinoallomurus sp.]|nr:transcriptional regulator, family [Actinoallomurus sp.]